MKKIITGICLVFVISTGIILFSCVAADFGGGDGLSPEQGSPRLTCNAGGDSYV